MEGRNAMAMSGPGAAPYYIHRGLSGSPGSGSQPGLHAPQGMRTLPNQSTSLPVPSATVGGSVGTAFQVEPSPALSQHGINVGGQGSSVAQGEPVKRKRGRPRKYGPDGTMALALSPMSSPAATPGSGAGSSGMGVTGSGSAPSSQKRGRGRPPGTGRKQQLASCGEWISSSAGMGFTPHIITISPGEQYRQMAGGDATKTYVRKEVPQKPDVQETLEASEALSVSSGGKIQRTNDLMPALPPLEFSKEQLDKLEHGYAWVVEGPKECPRDDEDGNLVAGSQLAEHGTSMEGATQPANALPMGAESFPPHGIEWPSDIQITMMSSFFSVTTHLLAALEEFFHRDPLPSIEEVKLLLEQSTRGWHAFGFPRDIWMAKMDSLWEEFGRQHMIAARRRQYEEEMQKMKANIQSLKTRAETARTRVHELQQELANLGRELVDLDQKIFQEEARAADLERSLA